MIDDVGQLIGFALVYCGISAGIIYMFRPVPEPSRTHHTTNHRKDQPMNEFDEDRYDWDLDDRELHDYAADTWPLSGDDDYPYTGREVTR